MNRLDVKYDFELDLESNNSLKLINDRLKDNSKILEFGPANGRLTKHLNINRKCTVDIVEYNAGSGKDAARFARKAFLGEEEGDIEKYFWADRLSGEKYDYIILADVLEHLYDPIEVLKRCKDYLKDDGVVLLSVPNIANNNIILSLLSDEFNYTKVGLLDNTHIRFFTYKTIYQIADKLGYSVNNADYTLGPIGQTEVNLKFEIFKDKDLSIVSDHLLGNAYQFVFELIKFNGRHVDFNEAPMMCVPVIYYMKNGRYDERAKFECVDLKYSGDVYIARFFISECTEENRFRFDPIEGSCCCLELLDAHLDGGGVDVINSNALFQENGYYYFMTTDPSIEMYGELHNAHYIELSYKISVSNNALMNEITKKINGAKLEIDKLKNENNSLSDEIEKRNNMIRTEIGKRDNIIRMKDEELSAIKSTYGYKICEGLRVLRNKIVNKVVLHGIKNQ